MRVTAWIGPGTWPAVIDALRDHHRADQITLLAAADDSEVVPPGVERALMGRGRRRPPRDSARMARQQAEDLLTRASARLKTGPDGDTIESGTMIVTGVTERAITRAVEDADWLVMARDGDRTRLGPRSLVRAARFVLDHAPCTVELIWPSQTPGISTIPPPPQ